MDTNGTRFHLLQGESDWSRCRTQLGAPAFEATRQVQWNAPRNEVTLWQETFRFPGAKSDRSVSLDDRRGAGQDRFGNWYWIAPDMQSILVFSTGSSRVSTFWPAVSDADTTSADDGSFRPRTPAAPASALSLQGLAVTDDHYLVAGTIEPAGILIFDLYSGGSPRQRVWSVDFEPFDIAAREGGGVWILDRAHRRVWQVDRRFEVVAEDEGVPAAIDDGGFTSDDDDESFNPLTRLPLLTAQGWPVPAADPIAIVPLAGGAVLVLERDGGTGFARVQRFERGAALGAPASTEGMAEHIDIEPGAPPFTLISHDFTFTPRSSEDPAAWLGRVYVVGADGNQAYAFGVSLVDDALSLDPIPDYFPIRLFGGRALVTANGEAWYDCGNRWVRLVEQNRPRYADQGELWTPVLDSGIPGCVWHRLMLDACLQPGSGVEVYSRASDDWRELTLLEWLSGVEREALGAPDVAETGDAVSEDDLADWQEEPSPYLRGDGPELPYLPVETGPGRGTWELLLQHARGRYLQVKLVLHGDGRSTPRLRALRAWFPRFSYLDHYLPAVYREDATSASFLDRFLANTEGTFTTIEDRIAAAQLLFDVQSAPPETLDWLASWFGVAIDPSWEEDRRRLFITHALDFFAARGTVRGLQMALRLSLDECVDERLFTRNDRLSRRTAPVRIIERFRARRTSAALLGDVTTAVPGPRRVDATVRWDSASGSADLHRRYREALGLSAGTEFPLVSTGAPAGWDGFAAETLGFEPRAGATERAAWQRFVQGRYSTIAALNAAHASTWAAFDRMTLPLDEPVAEGAADDWRDFIADTVNPERRMWRDYLARRYRNVGALNTAWRKNWSEFSSVPLPDHVPADAEPLAVWIQFEGSVLAMQRSAHRFTVMLPVPRHLRTDTPAQQRRLAVAKAVLELEKPAHTVFDIRFYWAMFRLGEARLGDDTLIDLGSRSPELMAPMVLGEGYLAEAFLSARPGEDAPERMQIGRDRIGRSARTGGP